MAIDVSALVRTKRTPNGAPAMEANTVLAQAESELAELNAELATIARLVAAPGEATVDALERALTRREALRLRMGALEARINGERVRMAEAEQARKMQEAAALVASADALLAQAVETLLTVQPFFEQHEALMMQAAALGSTRRDNRGLDAWRIVNGMLQTLAPGRFYPTDQRGTLADRTRQGSK